MITSFVLSISNVNNTYRINILNPLKNNLRLRFFFPTVMINQ